MSFIRLFLFVAMSLALAGCGSKFHSYNGAQVTSVQIHKADRKMYLLHKDRALKAYAIELGGNPVGPKQFEGDLKTPEGAYYITHRNPNSRYHLSLGISYPNTHDVAFATLQGRQAGGDIFIHGAPSNGRKPLADDWTAGCIAVSNREIETIYAMVTPGTPIYIIQ